MKGPRGSPFEAAIIGGGPAGAVAARLLAHWGHRVALLTRAEPHRRAIAESLPPSTRKLLDQAGVLAAVNAAGFYRSRGNTVWWESDQPRVERFPGGALGFQVLRPELDHLLLSLAESAGTEVHRDASVRSVVVARDPGDLSVLEYETPDGAGRLAAAWVLDASGRTALLARALNLRLPEPGQRTMALIAEWRAAAGWDLPDETHTLVEGYQDGWAWSVPMSPTVRQVAVMVDPRSGVTALAPDRRLAAMYENELQKTIHLRRLTAGAERHGPPAAHDASVYGTTRACGAGFLLLGDAASFIDPLSSFGVKKALASSWLAAVVTHTALASPSMTATALELFDAREREMYASFRRLAADHFGRAAGRSEHRFWTDRTAIAGLDDAAVEPTWPERNRVPAVRDALERLKRRPSIHLRRTSGWRTAARPAIRDREVILEAQLVARDGVELRFLRGVDLVALSAMAHAHEQVPDLFEAYNRAHAPVGLPDFLAALATLLAEGMLENRAV